MLLVKKFNFFLYFFSLKQGLEISINDVLDRKETFFDYKNIVFFQHLKNHMSQKGLINPCFWQKSKIFLYLDLVKIRLEIRFNNVLNRNKLF